VSKGTPSGQSTILWLHEARRQSSVEKRCINQSFPICPVVASKKREWIRGVPTPTSALQPIDHLCRRPVRRKTGLDVRIVVHQAHQIGREKIIEERDRCDLASVYVLL